MSTIDFREMIINQLAHINDASFLKAIKALVDSKAEEGVYKLSDFQTERIRMGREKLSKGKTFSHEEIQKEIDQWLESK